MAEKRKIEIREEEPENETVAGEESDTLDTAPNEDPGAGAGAAEPEMTAEELALRVKELEEELEKKDLEARENYDRFVRLSADFDNYKKRANKEMKHIKKYANEKFLRDLLSVVDNLERAIESGAREDSLKETILEGVRITLKDVERTLENQGVKAFDSAGEPFDPAYHQAMMQEQTEKFPENTVINELQKGYTICDRLLRPAMVVVSKAPPRAEDNDADSAAEK
jgi:molecular chaperone GrpE